MVVAVSMLIPKVQHSIIHTLLTASHCLQLLSLTSSVLLVCYPKGVALLPSAEANIRQQKVKYL